MSDKPAVAVLGTGIMGGAIARRLLDNGFPVTVWNRNRAKAEAIGANVAETPGEAVAVAHVVLTMLADGPVTEALIGEVVESIPDDAVWLQMATVGIEATDRLAQLAGKAGVPFVDAPILGTRQPAEEGRLVVFASGADELRQRCQPVFDVLSSKVLWVGDVGAGSRLKLVVNAWLAALVAGLAQSISLAEGIGVDPEDFLAAIEGTAVGPAYAQFKGRMMVERSYPPAFSLRLLGKDLDLVAEAAQHAKVPIRLFETINDLVRAAMPEHAEDDFSSMVEALRDR